MQKFKSYIAILFLALLLFPVAEKTFHELGHLQEEQCGVSETHFCKAEHACTTCAYLFASSPTPFQSSEEFIIFLTRSSDILFELYRSDTPLTSHTTPQLRGPPATV